MTKGISWKLCVKRFPSVFLFLLSLKKRGKIVIFSSFLVCNSLVAILLFLFFLHMFLPQYSLPICPSGFSNVQNRILLQHLLFAKLAFVTLSLSLPLSLFWAFRKMTPEEEGGVGVLCMTGNFIPNQRLSWVLWKRWLSISIWCDASEHRCGCPSPFDLIPHALTQRSSSFEHPDHTWRHFTGVRPRVFEEDRG